MRFVELIQRKSRWTKQQRVITVFAGVALVVAMMAGCNQTTAVGIVSYPDEASSSGGDELGVVVDENMRVLSVAPGWPAAVAGMQVGDVLDSVEGVSFAKDKVKAKEVIRERKEDKKLKLKVKRDDKELEINITSFQRPSGANLPTATPVPQSEDYF
ncbi:hypothetical protein BH10CHL1_BH10CHL1_22590 [soil metagenome]